MALGIALFSYNRPEYLDRVLSSLLANKDFDRNDFYLFQDYANDGSHRACHEVIAKYGLQDRTTQRKWNYGIARNQFTAYQLMFNRYEDVLFLEDDMVLATNYIKTIKAMLKQFMPDDKCWFVCGSAKPEKGKANEVRRLKRPQQWAHAFNRARWEKIREHYLPIYQACFEEVDYNLRDLNKLRAMTGDIGGQDTAKQWASMQAGYEYSIQTMLPRGEYIGEQGVHTTPQVYAKHGYSQGLEIEHKDLTKFVVIS